MYPDHIRKAFFIMAFIVISVVATWEWYCRAIGRELSYPNTKGFWNQERQKIEENPAATVIIGSSRVLFGIDLDVWEEERGEKPIQLSMEGTSPLPVLKHLSKDEGFRGTLYVGITPDLFFVSENARAMGRATKQIAYCAEETPSQKLSHKINMVLESRLVFLDEDQLGLEQLLNYVALPNREGVLAFPVFAYHFTKLSAHRQRSMTQAFLNSKGLQQQQANVWATFSKMDTLPPIAGQQLMTLLDTVKVATDRIVKRGGKVIFIRMPSSGGYLVREAVKFPREQYWDKLLAYTGQKGYYFADYPLLSGFDCPEESHLTPQDARTFTRNLLEILGTDKQPPVIVAAKNLHP